MRPAPLTAVLALAASVTATAITAPAASAEAHKTVGLRVASYNIHYGADSGNVFDPARTAEAIRAMDADIVGLQEVDVRWSDRSEFRDVATELANMLDMYVSFAPIYTTGEDGGFGVAILSRHPVRSAENHDLTRLSTQEPNPVPKPMPGFLEVVVKVKGTPVHVYTTHLDFRSDPAVRAAQVRETVDIMADDCSPKGKCPAQVLTGDFNAGPDAAELSPLWSGLTDTWTASDPGFTYPAVTPEKRIDFVTVSDAFTVRNTVVPQALASDHRPVLAELALRRHH
ncbi:endonuclease/exonuclease/phosphatase family protein [Streptomyces sp. FIT100]|uniref:endonuclease/exonuclease/phosphatase family protein n=1 Tax=Streptomyces sp. FIT100 TaxID=2837956 RepID=UPI0021C8494E|nr:endonuclease/exonuclease/phosphatase family protein [Streptomyces sp. FIT100]UUN25271.1 endonuclease/exonuclease/phosphatase family protein [Streptomyces sp. FIT100]